MSDNFGVPDGDEKPKRSLLPDDFVSPVESFDKPKRGEYESPVEEFDPGPRKRKRESGSGCRQATMIGLIMLLVCLGLAVLAGLGAVTVFNSLQTVGDSANGFLVALRDGETNQAFDMLEPSLANSLGRARFREEFANFGLTDWSFNSFNINNDRGSVSGTATIDGQTGAINVQLVNIAGRWLITGYQLD